MVKSFEIAKNKKSISVSGSEECAGCTYEAPDDFTIFFSNFFLSFLFSIAGSAASGIAVAEPNHPDEFQIRNRGNRVNEFLELLSRISNRSPPGGAASSNNEDPENNPGNDSSDNNRQDNQAAQRTAAAADQNSNANNDSSDNSDDEQEQNQGRFI